MKLGSLGATLALTSCALVAACSSGGFFSGGARDDAGLIIFYGDTARISAPDTVTRGASFEVSFFTFGGGCIRAIARDDVTPKTSAVEIRPYDHNSGGDICTADLITLKHAVAIRLDTPGSYVIRVIGQQRGGSAGSNNAPAEVTRAVIVR
jgi:hypothetical protein